MRRAGGINCAVRAEPVNICADLCIKPESGRKCAALQSGQNNYPLPKAAGGNYLSFKKHYFAQFFLRVSRHSKSSAGMRVLMVLV